MSQQLIFYTRYQKNNFFSEVFLHIKNKMKPGNVFLLKGNLGAGKTFFVQTALLSLFGLKEVTSPTFGYVNRWNFSDCNVSHFDLYRLENISEFFSLGFDQDLLDLQTLSFVEWPDLIMDLFKKELKSVSRELFLVEINHLFEENFEEREIKIFLLD